MARRIAILAVSAALLTACGSAGKQAGTAPAAPAKPATRAVALDWSVHLKPGPSVLTVDGIAVAAHGDVYVGDAGRNRIQELNSDGRLVRVLDGRSAGHGGFDFIKPGESASDAQGIAPVRVDAGGNVYVADTGHYLIEKFAPSGRFVGSWGGNGFKPGQFGDGRIVGLALDDHGHVFATDDLAGDYTVQEYSSNGSFMSRFGPKDNQPGQPTGGVGAAAAGPGGELFLTDDHLNAIIRYSPGGKLDGDFGSDVLSGPEGVTIDRSGHLFVANTGNGSIDEFTPGGHLVATYAGSGTSAFKDPTAVAVDDKGALYVYDQDRSALLKLEPR
jgi:hypothetical protein